MEDVIIDGCKCLDIVLVDVGVKHWVTRVTLIDRLSVKL